MSSRRTVIFTRDDLTHWVRVDNQVERAEFCNEGYRKMIIKEYWREIMEVYRLEEKLDAEDEDLTFDQQVERTNSMLKKLNKEEREEYEQKRMAHLNRVAMLKYWHSNFWLLLNNDGQEEVRDAYAEIQSAFQDIKGPASIFRNVSRYFETRTFDIMSKNDIINPKHKAVHNFMVVITTWLIRLAKYHGVELKDIETEVLYGNFEEFREKWNSTRTPSSISPYVLREPAYHGLWRLPWKRLSIMYDSDKVKKSTE